MSEASRSAPTPFSIFGLAPAFRIDAERLEAAYERAILKVHPDRFAGRSAAERRVAEQWSARINEAHAILADPVRRAAWLCEAAGTPVEAETNTRMPPDFLLAQIDRREALESAKTLDAVEALLAQAGDEARRLEAEIAAAADDEKNWPKAADAARRLMFLQRFIGEAKKARGAFL